MSEYCVVCCLCHLCLWQRVCFFLCFKNLVTCICIHLRFSSPIKFQWETQYCIQLDHFSKLDFQHQTQYLVSWKVAIFTSLANVIKDKLLRGRNGDWCEIPLLTKPWCIMWLLFANLPYNRTSVFLLFAESGSLMHRNFDINKNCELMKVCSWH